MFQTIFARVRERRPLVHCITNYISANDCANILLACGASPVMADAPQEAAEITARCAALCLNLGTLSTARAEAMLHSGQTANRLGLPVVLDPVGAGASSFRTETALQLLREVRVTVIATGFDSAYSAKEPVGADLRDKIGQHDAEAGKALPGRPQIEPNTIETIDYSEDDELELPNFTYRSPKRIRMVD